jgi:hypothetical protein
LFTGKASPIAPRRMQAAANAQPPSQPSPRQLGSRRQGGRGSLRQARQRRRNNTARSPVDPSRPNPGHRARVGVGPGASRRALELLHKLDGFEYRGEAPFRAWLYNSVLNILRDKERHGRRSRATRGGRSACRGAARMAGLWRPRCRCVRGNGPNALRTAEPHPLLPCTLRFGACFLLVNWLHRSA